MPDKPSNTLDLVFMYYLWHNLLICPFQVEPTIFVLIPVSFRFISVYSGVIPARSGTFRYHSCPFRFIPASFCLVPVYLTLGTFGSDYDNDYEYEFFNVYSVRMRDCVRLSRQLVLSSKSRRRPDANYEIFDKSHPPTTSSLQVQRRVKRLVFKGADTL